MARVNKALRLARVPSTETKILRALDAEGFLGAPLFLVGTNALFAYESRAGLFLTSDLVATGDIDLLWDERKQLSLVISDDAAQSGLLGVLRKVDKSFTPTGSNSFRAANDAGFLVDLIRPIGDWKKPRRGRIGQSEEDLYGVGIEGLEWLINSPKMEEIVIGADGKPLFISCIDPRAYALHKWWLSTRRDRHPRQKPRDAAQAIAVATLCIRYFGQTLDSSELSALPKPLREQALALTQLVENSPEK